MRNTGNFVTSENWSINDVPNVVTDNGIKCLKLSNDESSGYKDMKQVFTGMKPNTQYTYSFLYKISLENQMQIDMLGADNYNYCSTGGVVFTISSNFQKYTYTFTTNSNVSPTDQFWPWLS